MFLEMASLREGNRKKERKKRKEWKYENAV
jgi:hypothetical protein